jgi:hypothetical protein
MPDARTRPTFPPIGSVGLFEAASVAGVEEPRIKDDPSRVVARRRTVEYHDPHI